MDSKNVVLDDDNKRSPKPLALIIFGSVVGGLAITITVVSAPFIFPFFRRVCLPYVPATTQQVENVLEALKGRSGRLIDLGSGDGRIVIAAAQQGFPSTGIELNPWLVLYSKIAAFYLGLSKQAKFQRKDLWKYRLQPYKNVVIFGVESMMEKLEEKLIKELEVNSYIICCRFPLCKLQPILTIGHGVDKVWIYHLKQSSY